MPGAAGAGDPHLEQAMLAQLPPVSYLSRWQRGNSAPPPSPAPAGTAAAAPPAAQGQASAASPGGGRRRPGLAAPQLRMRGGTRAETRSASAHARAARGRPAQGPADDARAQADSGISCRQGSLTLAQALAQDGEAARGMRVVTVVRALPGIGAATAARLMREAGIDAGRRAGALTTGQRAAAAWPPWRPWTRSWPLVATGARSTPARCSGPERLASCVR